MLTTTQPFTTPSPTPPALPQRAARRAQWLIAETSMPRAASAG